MKSYGHQLKLSRLIVYMYGCSISSSTASPEGKNKESYSTVYRGVHYSKQDGKCQASLHANNKKHYLGVYRLAADAAWAHDLCLQHLCMPSKEPNFKTIAQYCTARRQEAKDRDVHVTRSEIQEYLTSKVNDVVSAVVQQGGTLRTHNEKVVNSSSDKK